MDKNIETVAESIASTVATEITDAAKRGGTEADFRREAARILDNAAKKAELSITPRDEYSVASGRVDSLYNKLIIEYKVPGKLRNTNEGRTNQDVIAQTKNYILDVAEKHKKEAHRLAGVVTDGRYFIFIRRFGDNWAIDDPEPVNTTSTERFLRLLFALSTGSALIPENLIEDFGPKTLRAWRAVGALYQALHKHTSRSQEDSLVSKLFEQWKQFFGEATDYKEWSSRIESKREFRDFITGMKLDPKFVEAPKIFFALHTYYALLIKLVASLAAARFAGRDESLPFSEFSGKEGQELQRAFAELEHGGLFWHYGIHNFLEGDFFGWYVHAWDKDIEEALGKLVNKLLEYDPGTLELAPENARDLLKNLYHSLLPKEIRHDLGEYYTPDWLAEHVIRQTLGDDLGDAEKRVMDPACGSGTFLVLLIKFIKERAKRNQQAPQRTLELILQNVIGFDLNPLAVIAARTNYLLALGDLLKDRMSSIDIPVYQADSVLTPSKGKTLFDGTVYPMETSVGEFRVPAAFAEQERIDALTNELDQAVEDGISSDSFLTRLEKNPQAKFDLKEIKSTTKDLTALYEKLKELHNMGLNGVWARIIKNAFAPLFTEPCHYVVGNPPWVNWESLPDRYRERTKPLWIHYELFPKFESGMSTILGSAKYDISMLFTYVAIDRYLKKNGKLGFVISQSLLKTSGAGQGFRRFVLPDKTSIGVCKVDDFVAVNPFEGATNRTATFVLTHGVKTCYPIPYVIWKKKRIGRGSKIPFDGQYSEVFKNGLQSTEWCATPISDIDSTGAWLTVRKGALPAIQKVLSGQPCYQGRAGTFTGGANGVFWISVTGVRGKTFMIANVTERIKKKVAKTQAAVESELVFPLLRGCDVSRWYAKPEISILLTHRQGQKLKAIPVKELEVSYPKAYSYLKKFETLLRKRAAFKRYFKSDAPFYSIFNIGNYTFSPWKVVWREVAETVDAAVINSAECRGQIKTVIPDHTCIQIESNSEEEAHYLCALLNSSPARLAISQYIVLHPDPHVLKNLGIPKFDRADRIHKNLSLLSKEAHTYAQNSEISNISVTEKYIDTWAAKLWNLTDKELIEIKNSLEEARQ